MGTVENIFKESTMAKIEKKFNTAINLYETILKAKYISERDKEDLERRIKAYKDCLIIARKYL